MFESIDSERFLELYDYFESLREDSQRRKLGEEHDELIEELIKFEWGVGDIKNIISELADNFFLLLQHMYAYDIEPQEVYDELMWKLERTEKRKKDKYYEK
jgi:phosphoribosyl-ATP pyrophosphohydrolase